MDIAIASSRSVRAFEIARPAVREAPEQNGAGVPASGAPSEQVQAVQQYERSQELTDRRDSRVPGELSEEEQRVVQELKARDREVRAHEQAHKSVGGPYAGAISYDYQRGPDGQNYAIGGSVPIDASPEADPEETIAKMEVVIRAALAPAEPSPQDRTVAAQAQQQLIQAHGELRAQEAAERRSEQESGSAPSPLSAAYEPIGDTEPTVDLFA
ncbi:putative metalloprotease CJM1_0395 family protein [Parvularcula maris]|uniref:SprA-related family protein n=1 Tax=Parvularcula maris TaxID=2965077 RepID=A0A9X2L7D9_9PROT|nr:putative metalloprotease CJM1_0395 family protein [Parvularcula maris]MCQ8184435.1 hypothetical protein [Parvularcula maris]